MLVKCISNRFNHIHWGTDASGKRSPKRIRPGDTFPVKAIPPEWEGMVVPVDGSSKGGGEEAKSAITNPAEGDELTALKAEYKAKTGTAAHHTWDADKIRAKLSELGDEE